MLMTSSASARNEKPEQVAGEIGSEALRVLHVVDSLEFGGVQTILKQLFEFQRGNADIFLLALRRSDTHIEIDHPNVLVHSNWSRFSLAPLQAILQSLREHRIQVIHCHLFRSQLLGCIAAWLRRREHVRVVFHEHGSALAVESGSRLEGLAFAWFQKVVAPRIDAHISISKHVEGSLAEITRGRIRKSEVVYNPVRCPAEDLVLLAADRARAREELGIPPKTFVVGMAARVVRRKGWREFLGAMSLLADRYPIYFLIAGDGPEFSELKATIVSRHLEQRGAALGYVQGLAPIYAALDCFVMPSHWEGAGLSHLEAQCFFVPVVACDVAGLNETVQANENCLLCRPNDALDMAAKIELLIADPEARSRIAWGGRRNAERFSVQKYVRELEAIYRELTTSPVGSA
jgi:glycosyltransferase involved in cell wall biosynthesis